MPSMTPIKLAALAAPERGALRDRHGRVKRKLRVSLTDRCNLRCLYCMPDDPQWLPRDQLLRREELLRLARLFVTELGITHLRVTGGEPLMRKDALECIAAFNTLRAHGLERIALTSNGVLLARHADALAAAGLDDVNVSLDAVTPGVFRALTGGELAPVLDGIRRARDRGLPVKLNAVVIRGYNDGEILPLADWACAEGLPLRFIEFMPLDNMRLWREDRVVRGDEILAALRKRHRVEALEPEPHAPARYYRIAGGARLGLITSVSNPFCASCDRIRLTARGELYACLFSRQGLDLGTRMRAGTRDETLLAEIRAQVWAKEPGYAALRSRVERPITMNALGG